MGRVRASIHSVQLPFVSVSLYLLQKKKKKMVKRSAMVTLNALIFERERLGTSQKNTKGSTDTYLGHM